MKIKPLQKTAVWCARKLIVSPLSHTGHAFQLIFCDSKKRPIDNLEKTVNKVKAVEDTFFGVLILSGLALLGSISIHTLSNASITPLLEEHRKFSFNKPQAEMIQKFMLGSGILSGSSSVLELILKQKRQRAEFILQSRQQKQQQK